MVSENSERELGAIKWFDNEKGFGAIENDQGQEIFIQLRTISGSSFNKLEPGQKITYAKRATRSGYEAIDIELI